jgi:3-deoxy-D-manno-octulosonic-acid transferase
LTTLAEHRKPVVIVNAKMSEKSLRLHARTGFVAQALRRVTAIGVQSVEHETRLRALGVDPGRIEVTGNMKYDLVAAPQARDDARRARLGLAPTETVIIGGSLHEGEDESLIAASAPLIARHSGTRLIIVPRYPQKASQVADNLEAHGLAYTLKSELDRGGGGLARDQVLVVDTLGELRELYRIADIAFVGGSLFFRGSNKGGHNLMEPAICGVPVVFGPYNFSFRETAEDLISADAGIEVDGTDALSRALSTLAEDRELRRTMGERARDLVLAGRGATARNFALLERALAGRRH